MTNSHVPKTCWTHVCGTALLNTTGDMGSVLASPKTWGPSSVWGADGESPPLAGTETPSAICPLPSRLLPALPSPAATLGSLGILGTLCCPIFVGLELGEVAALGTAPLSVAGPSCPLGDTQCGPATLPCSGLEGHVFSFGHRCAHRQVIVIFGDSRDDYQNKSIQVREVLPLWVLHACF